MTTRCAHSFCQPDCSAKEIMIINHTRLERATDRGLRRQLNLDDSAGHFRRGSFEDNSRFEAATFSERLSRLGCTLLSRGHRRARTMEVLGADKYSGEGCSECDSNRADNEDDVQSRDEGVARRVGDLQLAVCGRRNAS